MFRFIQKRIALTLVNAIKKTHTPSVKIYIPSSKYAALLSLLNHTFEKLTGILNSKAACYAEYLLCPL